jgi:serine/threonine-protein kinase
MRLEDLNGRRLGRYEITGLLGRGGMAAVYRAHDTALRRDVALKVLYPQYAGDTALVQRFQREAVLAANLDHPNILPIYDVGEADGLVYIAMRLLSGRSFADILRLRRSLPLAELTPIVEQIASALDYAHARQIVHRDIKPANILIEGLGDAESGMGGEAAIPHAVLTDFGIAKSLDPMTTGLTVTGVLIGTPEYMAPEQIRGSQTVDARADIYALGVLVYRALTGRRPFEGGTQEILMGHLQGTIPDASSIDPTLPAAVDAVLRQALARAPEQRYRSAGEFARALRSAAGMAMATPPPAMRRELDSRAVVPQVALNDIAQPNGVVADQPTRKGTIVPSSFSPHDSARTAQPARPQPARATRPAPRESRGSGAAWAILGLILALAIGGGILYAAGLLSRSGDNGGGAIATARPTDTPAPTDVPVTPTAAPTAVAVAPTEAPTAAPSAVPATPTQTSFTAAPTRKPTAIRPAPTKTPAPSRTPQPSSTPTPTTASTLTPTPTRTPTITPSPTSAIPLQGGFKLLLEQDQGLRQQLGDPTKPESGGPGTTTEQQFENGSMFYFQPTDQIYVLYDDKTWQVFEHDELKGLPEPPPANCAGPMKGGFALVWGSFPKVRERLGCSTSAEPVLFEGAYQPFERGTLLWSKRGLGDGPTIYVLFIDHVFERHKDPNQ